jgi:putative DNA primase/helicase
MIGTSANLNDSDLQMLKAGFIDSGLAEAARLRRVDDQVGSEIVGRPRKGGTSYAGIAIPYFQPNDSDNPREYRLRRDQPDYEHNGGGELKEKGKYLSPPGRSNMLYFPPGVGTDELGDTKLPCVITEGEKKTLALYRLANEGSGNPRFMPIGVSGVWNWKGTIGKTSASNGSRADVKGVIPDFDLIEWQGRDVTILFDANVQSNQSVWSARQSLARELAKRGANVLYAELPNDSGVNGIDDYLGKIEREKGTTAAIAAGLQLLKIAVPFGDAKPLFDGEPKPLDQTLKPVAEIDAECLPSVLRNWLLPASKVIGCPFDFLVLSAITVAGSLIGSRVRIKPLQNSNWFVVPNLYAGIVGLPSTKKSPALDEARKPILRLQAASREAYQNEKADYEIDTKYFEKDDKDARNKSKTASEYKNKLATIQKPTKPTMRRFETNDATSQKMIQFLSENPNGLILTRDELTGWLKSLEAEYDQAARSFYLELWKGGITYDHARVSENREITITSGTLSIIGGIQPSRLQHYISEAYSYDNADGLPQRILFAYPNAHRQTKKPTQSDYEQLERGLETACAVFKELADKQFGGHAKSDSGDSFFPVQFDQDAQTAFDEWKDDTENEAMRIESDDEVFASFLYKLPKSCAAIALIFHCIENINEATVPDRITVETTVKSLAYIEVLTTHARRVFALGENRIFSLAQIVLGKIKTGKLETGFTARELKRKHWSGLQSGEMIQDVLTLLIDYGYLKTIDSGETRPTTKYYVHTAIQIEVCDEVE